MYLVGSLLIIKLNRSSKILRNSMPSQANKCRQHNYVKLGQDSVAQLESVGGLGYRVNQIKLMFFISISKMQVFKSTY